MKITICNKPKEQQFQGEQIDTKGFNFLLLGSSTRL